MSEWTSHLMSSQARTEQRVIHHAQTIRLCHGRAPPQNKARGTDGTSFNQVKDHQQVHDRLSKGQMPSTSHSEQRPKRRPFGSSHDSFPHRFPSIPIDSQLFPNHSTPFPTVSEATFFRSSGRGYRGIPAGVIPKCHVSHTKLWDQIAPRKCSRGVGHLQPVASMWSELHGETCFLVEKEKLKMAILSK